MKTKVVAPLADVVALRTAGGVSPADAGQLTITVVFAQPAQVWQTRLSVPAGTDVGAALRLSGFAQAFPGYPIDAAAVGIFGRRCRIDEAVAQGDRIEIYRPLSFDPMASRRRRAEHRKAVKHHTEFRPRRVRSAEKP